MSLMEISSQQTLWQHQNYDPRLADYKHRLLPAVHRHSTPLGPYFSYIFDLETIQVTYVDDSFEEITGYPCEFVRTQPLVFLQRVLTTQYQQAVLQAFATIWTHCLKLPLELRSQLRVSLDFCLQHPNGELRRILLEISHISMDNIGCPVYAMGRCSDITHWSMPRKVTLVLEDPLNFQKQDFSLLSAPEAALLSKREKEILGLLSAGYSSKSIASALDISYHTVNTHRQNMLNKLGIKKTTGLIRFALANGLL